MKVLFPGIQKLGRSLMLPIAVLPVAGLLLRLGQPDLLSLPYVAAAGNAVFANLGLLFAIGVAVGLARENNGAAGLAAVVAYLVTTEGAKVLISVPPDVIAGAVDRTAELLISNHKAAAISKLSVPAGLLSGIMAGLFYNRFADFKLPDYLAFFAGRRFVPIVSGFAALALAALFGYGWPVLEGGMNTISESVLGAGEIGLFAYGLLNRVLIVTGLHHILNNLAWFLVGDFEGVTGDLRRFFAGDPTAGAFMSGFFPVMMFGLPAACLAMYRTAASARRKSVGGLLLSMALTSFLTGITEPIEFTFMFLAPVLYGIHAVLTGISMVLMDLADIRLGFGFSAGLFDYVLNFNRATKPLLMLPFGAVYFLIYFLIFRTVIVRLDLKTPGREDNDPSPLQAGDVRGDETASLLAALGGPGNLLEIDACTTRLRLTVVSQEKVNRQALKALGAAGVMQATPETLQVVIGLRADEIAANLRRAAGREADSGGYGKPPVAIDGRTSKGAGEFGNIRELLQALGGAGNILDIEAIGTRLQVTLKNQSVADASRVVDIGLRGLAILNGGKVQVVAGGKAGPIARQLQALLSAE